MRIPDAPLPFLLGFAFFCAAFAASPPSFELIEIRDTATLAELWRAGNGTGHPAPGAYQVLIRNTEMGREGFLLREGTQILGLPEFALTSLQAENAGRLRPEKSETPRDWEDGFFPGLWKRRDSLLAWLQWPTGITVNFQNSFSQNVGAAAEQERRLDLNVMDRPIRWVHLEAGVHQSQFGGGLSQSLYDPSGSSGTLPYWSDRAWWWHAAIGVPGVKWEVSLADRAFPEFFWLDSGGPNAARLRVPGRLIRQWSKGDAIPGNLAQAFHFRFNALRYSIHLDGDAYRAPVHEFMLEDLPMPFGAWGMGLTLAGSTVYSRAWMDLLPLTLTLPDPHAFPSRVRFAFLRFDFSYFDKQHFHLALATRVSIDNPAFRRPGDRS